MFESILSTVSPASDERVVPLADLFRVLGDPTRLRIVLACVQQRRAVGAIAEALGLSASLVSHHLRLLRATRMHATRCRFRCLTRRTVTMSWPICKSIAGRFP